MWVSLLCDSIGEKGKELWKLLRIPNLHKFSKYATEAFKEQYSMRLWKDKEIKNEKIVSDETFSLELFIFCFCFLVCTILSNLQLLRVLISLIIFSEIHVTLITHSPQMKAHFFKDEENIFYTILSCNLIQICTLNEAKFCSTASWKWGKRLWNPFSIFPLIKEIPSYIIILCDCVKESLGIWI